MKRVKSSFNPMFGAALFALSAVASAQGTAPSFKLSITITLPGGRPCRLRHQLGGSP